MPIAPLQERDEHGDEVKTFLRWSVLIGLGGLAVQPALEQPLVDERLESVAEDVLCDSGVPLQLAEAPAPEQDLPHHEQRPALSDDLERPGDRAVLIGKRSVGHADSVADVVAFCYRPAIVPPHAGCKMQPCCRQEAYVERRWKVLAVVSVAVFVVGLDMFIVNIAFPKIESDFSGSGVSGVSWVLNAYAIVLAALMVPAGRIADRIGRRRGFLIGLVVFTVGSALCGAAPSVVTLVLARVIQAVGASLLLPTSLALLLPEFSPAERPMAIGIWSAVGGVAAAAGPPIGGLLVHLSWRLVFLVNVPIGAIALVYAMRLLRESRAEGEARPDLLGGLLLMIAIGLLALGLVKAPDWGWGSAQTLAALGGSVVGTAVFWWRCHVHPSPVIDPAMLRVRSFALASSASIAFNAAFAAMLLGNVLFLTGVWHYSVLHAGVALMPGPAMAAATAVPGGRLAGRFGQRTIASLGITLFAAGGAWWLWHLGATPSYANELLPGQIMTGTGVGLTIPSLASAATASLPPARFATGSAVFTMTRQIGFALGVSVLVAVIGSAHTTDLISTFRGGWLFMVIASLTGAVLAAAMGPVRQHVAAPAAPAAPRRRPPRRRRSRSVEARHPEHDARPRWYG